MHYHGVAWRSCFCVACGKESDAKKAQEGRRGASLSPRRSRCPRSASTDRRFNFIYDDGAPAYGKARDAAKKKDWAEARKRSARPRSRRIRITSMRIACSRSRSRRPARTPRRSITWCRDRGRLLWVRPTRRASPDLKEFLATPHGAAVAQLATQIHDEYAKRVKTGLWLVGAAEPVQVADKPGVQYGLQPRRAVRVRSREQALLPADAHRSSGRRLRARTGGTEVAVLGFDKIDQPAVDDVAAAARARVGRGVDPTEWKQTARARINLPSARAVAVGYGAGDQLLVATAPASGAGRSASGRRPSIKHDRQADEDRPARCRRRASS